MQTIVLQGFRPRKRWLWGQRSKLIGWGLGGGERESRVLETFKIGNSVVTDNGPAGGRPQPQQCRGWVPGTPALILVRPYRILNFPRFRHPKKEWADQKNDQRLEPYIRRFVDP